MWAPHLSDSDARQQLLFKLPPNISVQKAKLVALLKAIEAHRKPHCVYTDSRYAFDVVTDFMAQWQLQKFLTSAGMPVKHYNTVTTSSFKPQQKKKVKQERISMPIILLYYTETTTVNNDC